MAKYKSMASEGSFGAYQMQARDNSGQILEAADKKIRGMERARAFEKEQEDLYLRAQKFAQGREEESREINFKLETENRENLMEVQKRDFQLQIEAAQAQARGPTQQENQLAALVPQLAEAFATGQKTNAENKRKAASAAAYEHGLSHVTLKNVLGLSANLNLSAFKATEYVGSLSEIGWSEERIDALYKHQYLTRGDKAWVDNKALLVNSIPNYQIGAQAITADNEGKTPDEQINALRAYTQDWIANLSIGDRPVSAEMMGTIVNPKVRSIETKLLNELQKTRAEHRESALLVDKNNVYNTTFSTDGPTGILALASSAANRAEERKFITEFIINKHKSGSMSKGDLQSVLTAKFERSDGAMVSLKDDYGGTDEVAKAMVYFNGIDAAENKKFTAEKATQKRELNSLDQNVVNQIITSGQDITLEQIEQQYEEGKKIYGPSYTSPALETAKEYTRSAQALEEILPNLADRVVEGAGEQELLDSGVGISALSTETNGMPSLLQLARRNDAARKNPNFKDAGKDIEAQIRTNEYVEAHEIFMSKDGLENEIAYWKGVYNAKYWENINKGAEGNEANLIAKTQTRQEIADYLGDEKNTVNGFARIRSNAKLGKETKEEIDDFGKKIKQLRLDLAPAEQHVKLIGEELMIEVTEAMASSKEIPAIFREGAAQMKQTPFEYQQYLAPAFPNVDQAEFDASTYQSLMRSIKPEKMPLLRRNYGVPQRAERAMNVASTAARRGQFGIPMPAGVQTPAWSAAGAVLKFAEGASYNIQFGGGTFDDFSRHPDEVISSNGLNSAAAGAYQFMPATWSGVSEKLGLQDFGPESQEMAARELALGRGVHPDKVYTSFEDFNNNFLIPLAPEWASLPTRNGQSYYSGQKAKSALALWEYYQQAQKQFGVN